MDFLTGYKTYIVAVLLIVIGLLNLIGIAIPGFTDDPGLALTTGIGLILGRVGSKNDVKKLG